MIGSLVVTLLPLFFLAVLLRTGVTFRRRQVDVDGKPPIDSRVFYLSKYSIVLVWFAVALRGWGIPLPMEGMQGPAWPSLILWVAGFALLFLGRLGLGGSFRIGSPREATSLTVNGLFSLSRNPMYVGVFSTLFAALLYTLNPLILVLVLFIVVVHHRIVLAEERFLRSVFGEQYVQYCRRVRRYL
jgi:protein-S-isoprenylcysteine O-methyltransferase Ste14